MPIWVPSIAPIVCGILQLQYSLNLLIASAFSFLNGGNLMKSDACEESSSD